MLEARITKAVVLLDDKTGGTVLMGVAEYYGDMVNFKVPYDWETLDIPWFVNEMKETLAKAFDKNVYQMDIQERSLLGKMKEYHEWSKDTRVAA